MPVLACQIEGPAGAAQMQLGNALQCPLIGPLVHKQDMMEFASL